MVIASLRLQVVALMIIPPASSLVRQVGGPATMQTLDVDGFITACADGQIPMDFVSTHFYPTDPQCQAGAPKARHATRTVDVVCRTCACPRRPDPSATRLRIASMTRSRHGPGGRPPPLNI